MGAEDDDIFLEICQRLLAADPDVELKQAFSSPGLRYRDRIFAMHVRGDLVVKLPTVRCEEVAADGGARPFRVGQRVMREWVVIGPERDFEWDALADEALAFARQIAAAA
jgi:TfoX/Sxy family transcriptional regulator of competence genes